MVKKIKTIQQLQSCTGIKKLSNLSENDAKKIVDHIYMMDKEVIVQLLSNIPNYVECMKIMIECFHDLNKKNLDSNAESISELHKGNLIILNGLHDCLKKEELSSDEREDIVEKMFYIARRMEFIDVKNKEFLLKSKQNITSWSDIIAFLVGVMIGATLSNKQN